MTKEKIEHNKYKFTEIVNSIQREGFNKDLLLTRLNNSDFFTAPATTKYHHAYKGGLCEYSLQVYDNLKYLNTIAPCVISEESIKIVSLFHNLSKMNYYEMYYRNQKVYCDNGTKFDDKGRYEWQQVEEYKVIDASQRFLYCNGEVSSEFIVRQFCPLTIEESVAILHHHGGMGEDSVKDSVLSIYSRYPLALLLHEATLLTSCLCRGSN